MGKLQLLHCTLLQVVEGRGRRAGRRLPGQLRQAHHNANRQQPAAAE